MSLVLTPNLRGAGLMVLAMAGFAVEDLLVKAAAAHMPVGQVLVMMGLCGALIFAGLSWRLHQPALPRLVLAPTLLLRSGCEISGRLFYSLALALTPLSTSSAILQATPLVVIAGAALIFGERVSRRRWLAVGFGFLGVLIILRPGVDGFSALSLLAVAGMLGFAGRDLATRAAPKGLSNPQLGCLGFVMMAGAGAVILTVTGGATLPSLPAQGMLAGATGFSLIGYSALTGAMRSGDISAVAPLRYSRLIFAMLLAMIFLGERPDFWVICGSVVVVLSGLYGLLRR